MKHLFVLLPLFLIGITQRPVKVTQRPIGTFEHVANSAAAGTPDGVLNRHALLAGDHPLLRIVATGKHGDEIRRLCTEALAASGFAADSTQLLFAEAGAFGIVCGKRSIPGTWLEAADRTSVRIGLSKIFTYGLTGRIETQGGRCRLYFPADRFVGFIQRTLTILGRTDASPTVEQLNRLIGPKTQIGFEIPCDDKKTRR